MFFYKFSFSHKFSYKPRKLSYKPPQAFLQAPASFPFLHSSSPALQSALLFQQPGHLSQSPQPGHLSQATSASPLSQSPQPIPSANLSRTSSTSSPSISTSLSASSPPTSITSSHPLRRPSKPSRHTPRLIIKMSASIPLKHSFPFSKLPRQPTCLATDTIAHSSHAHIARTLLLITEAQIHSIRTRHPPFSISVPSSYPQRRRDSTDTIKTLSPISSP